MDIEEVEKIITETIKVSSFDARGVRLHNVYEAARQICQLFEVKADEGGLLTDKEQGIKEAVEWVNNEGYWHTGTKFVMDTAKWQAKLKEWGIE